MIQPMPKQDFLEGLMARNNHNRQIVATVFVPMDQAQRSWQPDPNEWSIDQCFHHLVIAYDRLSPNFIPALNKPEPPDSDGIFRPSWLARRFMEKQFDPLSKTKTVQRNSPSSVHSPESLTHWLAQQTRLTAMLEQAAQADLQTMCWVIKWVPIRYNLGDYLKFFVSHDELHIDQAQRVLMVYEQQGAAAAD